MDEWHIGDPVDWGDGFMDAQNWGHENNGDDDENRNYRQYDDYRYSSQLDDESKKRQFVIFYREPYEKYMKLARDSSDDDEAVACYKLAIGYGLNYLDALKRNNMADKSFPSNKQDLLPAYDFAKCTQMHIRYRKKPRGFFQKSLPQEKDLEEIFKKTDNKIMR